MKKIYLSISLLLVFTALFSACTPAEAPVLTVGEKAYTRSELEAFSVSTADYTNKDGDTSTYEGVSLVLLLEDAGLTDTGSSITFIAADGYQAEMSLEEALACADCIVAFDDSSLRMVMPDLSSKLQIKDVVEISVQ